MDWWDFTQRSRGVWQTNRVWLTIKHRFSLIGLSKQTETKQMKLEGKPVIRWIMHNFRT